MEETQTQQSNTSPNADYFGASASPMVTGYDLTRYQYFLASPFFAGFDDFQNPKRKLFLEEFRQMSSNLRAFLTSIETARAIFTASQENNLEENQIYQTAELFRDLISGKVFIKDLPITLAQKINIEDSKASTIVNKVISKSFGPIIEDVKRIQRSKFPDKISQIQKESQPAGLTQPGARPLPPRPTTEVGPQIPEVQPQQSRPFIPSQPQAVRPPLQMSRSEDRGSSIASQSGPPRLEVSLPNTPSAIRPSPLQTPPTPPPNLTSPQRPVTPSQSPKPRLEFKVPDLSGIKIPAATPSGLAEESLEKELEKVESIIDLRNKPPDK